MFPVWTEENGLDDIHWYQANRLNDVSWEFETNLIRHGYETGQYNIHAYVQGANGNLQLLDNTTVKVSNLVNGNIRITNKDMDQGKFTILLENVKASFDFNIKVPVWSEENGQGDVYWYKAKKAGDCWYADVQAAQHGYDSGIYNIHCYAYDSRGVKQLVDSTTKNFTVTPITDGNISSSVVATLWIIYDINNGRTIYSRNPDGNVQLAS